MKLGIHLPQYGRAASPESIRDVAQGAEAMGYADVWVSDHVVQPAEQGYPSAYLYEALLTLGWAAAATTTVGLGTSVLVVPQYHPLQMANALASLDSLSGGRLTVGVGVGWSREEYGALDQEFATRGRRMDEALAIFRAAWGPDPVSFSGEHYEFADLKILPKPAHAIPVIVGGGSEAAIRRAIELGDGFHAISTPPEELASVIAGVRAARPEPAFTISYRTGWDPSGMDHGVIIEEAAAYEAAGVDHVIAAPWRTSGAEWLDSMEILMGLVG